MILRSHPLVFNPRTGHTMTGILSRIISIVVALRTMWKTHVVYKIHRCLLCQCQRPMKVLAKLGLTIIAILAINPFGMEKYCRVVITSADP